MISQPPTALMSAVAASINEAPLSSARQTLLDLASSSADLAEQISALLAKHEPIVKRNRSETCVKCGEEYNEAENEIVIPEDWNLEDEEATKELWPCQYHPDAIDHVTPIDIMTTTTAAKGVNERIFAKLGPLSMSNSTEFIKSFRNMAMSEGCLKFLEHEVAEPEGDMTTERKNWEIGMGRVAILFEGFLGPNALALVHADDDQPHVSWTRITKNYTQKQRLTGMAALAELINLNWIEGEDMEHFLTKGGTLIRRINTDLRPQLAAEAARLTAAGTPDAAHTALNGVLSSLFILASIPQKYADLIDSTLGDDATYETITQKLRQHCAEENLRLTPAAASALTAQALASREALGLVSLTPAPGATRGRGRGRGGSSNRGGYGGGGGRGGGNGGGGGRHLTSDISNAEAWPWGRNAKGQFRIGKEMCRKCFGTGHWADASANHPGCPHDARRQAQSRCTELGKFGIMVGEAQVVGLVAYMLDEPFHPHFPNDPNATANAFRVQHDAYAAYAEANVGRFDEAARFTSHTFSADRNSVTFDGVGEYGEAVGQGALRVTVDEEMEVTQTVEFPELEEASDDEESEAEGDMDDVGEWEVSTEQGYGENEGNDDPNQIFGSRLGGYVVIPTHEYDMLLAERDNGVESESLARDCIAALERSKLAHARESRLRRQEQGSGCYKCRAEPSHEDAFLCSTEPAQNLLPLTLFAERFLNQSAVSEAVLRRLDARPRRAMMLREWLAELDGDEGEASLAAYIREVYVNDNLPARPEVIDTDRAFLHAELAPQDRLYETANFATPAEARNYYFPAATNTETAGKNYIRTISPSHNYTSALRVKVAAKIVLDSGCSRHMTDDFLLLMDYIKYKTGQQVRINGAGGGACYAEGYGTLRIVTTLPDGKTGVLIFKNVLYAPQLGHTLISTSSMMRSGWTFTNTKTTVKVIDPLGALVGLGQIGVHAICLLVRPPLSTPSLPFIPVPSRAFPTHAAAALTVLPLTGPEVAHERFGHLVGPSPSGRVVDLAASNLSPSPLPCQSCGSVERKSPPSPCEPCELAKASRTKVSKVSIRRATQVLELLYSDLWGPAPVAAIGGYRYALGIIDDHTRWCWVAGLRKKSDTVTALEPFFLREERKHEKAKVKRFFSDKGGEYDGCKQLLERLGIEQHQSTPYVHHEMGEIEWFWRRAFEGVRAWLIRSTLPLWLWLEALSAWTYVRNRLPTRALHGKSPYFQKYRQEPDLAGLLAWGSLAYALIPAEVQAGKLYSRGRRCFFVGYDENSKSLRMYDPVKKMVFMAYHVKVFEGVYQGNATAEEMQMVLDWEMDFGNSEGGDQPDVDSGEPANAHDSVLFNGGGSFRDAPPTVRPSPPVSPVAQNDDAPQAEDVATGEEDDNESEEEAQAGPPAPRQEHRTRGFMNRVGGVATPPAVVVSPADQPRYPVRNRQQVLLHGDRAPEVVVSPPVERGQAMFDTPESSPEPENGIALEASVLLALADHPLLNHAAYDQDIEDDAETIALKVWSSNPDEPSYRSVMKGPDRHSWDPAISAETAALRAMGCWDEALVDLPPGFRAIPLEFVLLIKRDAVGVITKYKARLVARGDLQREGDFGETFAPTIKMASFRNMLALLAQHSGENRRTTGPAWKSGQLDVSSAYLHGKLKEEVYVKQVPGEEDGTNRVRRLRKTLYGLRQSGHEWNNVFHAALLEIGFAQIDADAGVYYRKRGKLELILGIHVDDGAIVGNDSIAGVIEDLNKRFEIKDLGELREFLGLQIDHNHATGEVRLHQSGYAQRILERCGMEDAKSVKTPCRPKAPQTTSLPNEDRDTSPLAVEYRAVIGMLLYLCISRPDIIFPVGRAARYSCNPTGEAWEQVKYLLRYVRGTTTVGILYGQGGELATVAAFVDADHGSDHESRVNGDFEHRSRVHGALRVRTRGGMAALLVGRSRTPANGGDVDSGR
ncbi:hypothetical protein P7C70_g3153, partial [Phenoliferia sp. Uapishka_3]